MSRLKSTKFAGPREAADGKPPGPGAPEGPISPEDLDDNGSVGASDLLSWLASCGPCPPKADFPANFDGNGNASVSDLLALLDQWGPCP